jgi:hypothetical protein
VSVTALAGGAASPAQVPVPRKQIAAATPLQHQPRTLFGFIKKHFSSHH